MADEQKKEQGAVEQKKEQTAPGQKESEQKEKQKPAIELTEKMKTIMESIEGMSVMELSNLVKALEDKFGVSAAAPVGVAMTGAAMAGAGAPGAEAAEEKSTFTVVLASVGPQKIQVIKEIRAVTTLGLKEAKDLVEAAPKPVKEAIPKEEAEKIKEKLEAVGAKVELK